MKLKVTPPRSRNPFVALALLRHAGRHRPSERTVRGQAARALQRELADMKPPRPDT